MRVICPNTEIRSPVYVERRAEEGSRLGRASGSQSDLYVVSDMTESVAPVSNSIGDSTLFKVTITLIGLGWEVAA